MNKFTFNLPVNLNFGCGVMDELAKNPLPGKRLMIVTGGNTIKTNGTLDRVCEMTARKVDKTVILDQVPANPALSFVDNGAAVARENGIDVVIGLGGGSSLDAAKAIAIMGANSGSLWDYVSVGSGKGKSFENASLPFIAIPTTAGTGSEGNKTAVISNTETNEKIGVRTAFPYIAYIDPELTLSIPARFTALQGYDALCHCMEAYTGVKATPASDPLALQGIKEIFRWLPVAVKNGSDIEARTHVSWAASLGGMVIYLSSCSSAHVIEHMLSGIEPKVEHGAGLVMISHKFHTTIAEHAPERYAEIADALSLTHKGQTIREKALTFLDGLFDLQRSIGIDDLRLSDYGFNGSQIERMIDLIHVVAGGALSRDRYLMSDDELEQVLLGSL